MIVSVLLACSSDSSPTRDEAPLIEAALATRCPVPRKPVPDGDHDLHRVTLADAGHCNDGTTPVMYVRPASDPAHATDWIIQLQGGGACFDSADCIQRWCTDTDKMTSRYAPETRAGGGILNPEPPNALHGWNTIEVPYCTSDLWLGTAGAVELEGPPAYRLYFEGDAVVQGVVRALRDGVTSDDGAVSLPALLDGRVVLSGSSAGAIGAAQQVDRLASLLPDAEVRVIVDSGIQPPPELLPAEIQDDVRSYLASWWADTWEGLWHARVDDSCEAGAPDPWSCADMEHVQRLELESPSLVHHDLLDPTLHGHYDQDFGISFEDYAASSEAMLRRLAAPGVAIHGSACEHHTSLPRDDTYLDMTVTDAVGGGPALSVDEVAAAWIEGSDLVAIDSPDGSGSQCPVLR